MKSTESKRSKNKRTNKDKKNHVINTGIYGRKSKENQTLNVLLILILVLILVLGSLFGVINFRQGRKMDLSAPYNRTLDHKLKETTDTEGVLTTAGFASDLCVSPETVARESVALTSEDEKALLFNLDTSTPVYAQGIYDRIYPASITKIMTAIVALKYGNMSDEVTISNEAVTLEKDAQLSGMAPGDKVTMDALFHALMIYSANDAAMAIAEHIGGTVENFVNMMNEEAKSLGMTGTHFVNPHGLHDDNHYTTAYDIYLMFNKAYRYQEFYDTMQTNVYNLNIEKSDGTTSVIRLDSTDKYLTGEKTTPKDVSVLGGKTGTTSQAGSCLAILSQNSYGQPFISIILNAENKNILYGDMDILLNQINQ